MSIRREIIDCGAMGSRNESRPPDNDNNNNEEIENTGSESEEESEVSETDSELSTTNDIFAFESDQSDSDDEMNNIIDRNYVYHDNIKNSEELPNANSYLKHVSSCTGLHMIQKGRILKSFKKEPIALFHLFIRKSFLSDCVRKWTNRNLDEKGKPEASTEELLGVVGIEIGMSYSRMNNMRDYWKKTFIGSNGDCGKIIGRERYMEIRRSLSFCSNHQIGNKSHLASYNDPSFYARRLMNHFNKNSTRLAVPTGAIAFDENRKRCKSRTFEKSYAPNKPEKYGLTFYAMVGSKYRYCYTISDNGTGNKTKTSACDRYTHLHKELKTSIHNMSKSDKKFDTTKATALYVAMMGHPTRKKSLSHIQDCGNKRWYFTDTYYIRHTLAKQL